MEKSNIDKKNKTDPEKPNGRQPERVSVCNLHGSYVGKECVECLAQRPPHVWGDHVGK